ncbi:MAG: hypothetical protein E6501_15375 [Bradyrhizobium sp.]|jgi:hypothetical protein|nr:hypothetical protein [Bradyrhizobium sp.]
MEETSKPLHDGEPQSTPVPPISSRAIELMILFENIPKLVFGDTDAGIPDLDTQRPLAAPAAEQHPAPLREFNRVRKQIAYHLLQELWIAANEHAARRHLKRDLPRFGLIDQIRYDPVEQGANREHFVFRSNAPGLNTIEVQQAVQHTRHVAQCLIEALHQVFSLVTDDLFRKKLLEQHEVL